MRVTESKSESNRRLRQKQPFLSAEMGQSSLSGEDDEEDNDDDTDSNLPDSYDVLEELYMDCQHSADDSHSDLLNRASQGHDHGHHPNYYHCHVRLSEKDATTAQRTYYRMIHYPDQHHHYHRPHKHGHKTDSNPTSIILALICLLLIAIAVVESAGIISRRSRELSPSSLSDDQDNNNSGRKPRLHSDISHHHHNPPSVRGEIASEEKTDPMK